MARQLVNQPPENMLKTGALVVQVPIPYLGQEGDEKNSRGGGAGTFHSNVFPVTGEGETVTRVGGNGSKSANHTL